MHSAAAQRSVLWQLKLSTLNSTLNSQLTSNSCLGYRLRRSEKGDVYAVDIGGTNLRTLYVRLSDARGEVVSGFLAK